MRCESVKEEIPLYVEDDLPGRRAEAVRSHLEGCASCRALAEEFRASQRWMRARHRAPDFSGAQLDELRRSVWRRLETEPRKAAAWISVERLWAELRHWAAQPTVAVAAVCLVVVGSLALSRLGGFADRAVLQAEAPEGPTEAELAAAAAEAARGAERLLAQARLVEEGGSLEALEDADEDDDDGQMRIEIRTRDPNVRIIWLSPQEKAAPLEN